MGQIRNILFCILICNVSSNIAQDTWNRKHTNLQFNIADVTISNEGFYYVNAKDKSSVFESRDHGISWTDVSDHEFKYDRIWFYKKNLFIGANKNLFYTNCNSACTIFKYEQGVFKRSLVQFPISTDGLGFNLAGEYFYSNSRGVYPVLENWRPDLANIIFIAPNRIIKVSYFSADQNYVITSNDKVINDSILVYKLNTGSGQVEMYSHLQINTNLRKEDIHITEAGDILFAINNQLLLADHRTPDIFEEVKLDSALNILKVEQIGRIANGQIFVLTDKGIYINSNLGLNHWTKLINLSLNIPSKIDKIVIHDTLNAILTVTDECDYTEAYFFIPSTLDWKLVNLNIDVNTFESLTKDNNNILYAYHNCYFKYSEDDGVNWNFLSINGEPVEQITTNKNGDAVAAVNQKIFILDKFSGLWKIANNTIFKIPNLKLKYFIKSGSELFIEGALGDFDSPNAKYFLFHSSDGGMNWSKINAFRKSAYYNYSGLSISVLENNTWIGHGDIVDTIVSSNDLGLTWNIDPVFENFSRARNIIQLPDNRKIICGRYKKKYGAYISSTSNEYELMNSYFENKIFDIYYIGPNFIFGNASYNDGVFFSTDLGKNITIDESGMAPNTFDQRYYYGLLYDEEQKIYVSLGFDGLYKATKNIFTSSKDLRPLMHSKFLKVNFDQSELQITMVDENVDFRSIKFEILNQLGQLIKQGKFEYKSNSINIQQALSGIYYFKVIYPNQSSEAIKFIKY